MLRIEGDDIIYDTPEELEAYRIGYREGLMDGLKKGAEMEHAKAEHRRIMEKIDREWEEKKRFEAERLRRMEEAERDKRIRKEIWELRNAAYRNHKW